MKTGTTTKVAALGLSLLASSFCTVQAAHQDGTVYGAKQWVQSLTQVCEADAKIISVSSGPMKGNGFHLQTDTYNISRLRAAAIVQWLNANAIADSVTFIFKRYKEGMYRETTCPLIRMKIADTKSGSEPRYETIMPEDYGLVDLGDGWSKAMYNFPANSKLYELAIVSWVDNRPPLPFNSYGNCDVMGIEVAAHNDSEKFVAKPSIDTNIRRWNMFGESPELISFDTPPRRDTKK